MGHRALRSLLSIRAGEISENKEIATMNKKYTPKSLILLIGVKAMQEIIKKDDMIFVLGSNVSKKFLTIFI